MQTNDDNSIDLQRLLFEPNVVLNGSIEEKTLGDFPHQLATVRSSDHDLIPELNTIGGDADAARQISLEVRLLSSHSRRSAYCLFKTYVYSAGITILESFDVARNAT